METYYRLYNILQLQEKIIQFILQGYPNRKGIIKNKDDYLREIADIKAFDIKNIPIKWGNQAGDYVNVARKVNGADISIVTTVRKSDIPIFRRTYKDIKGVLPYLKGCCDILDNEVENSFRFINGCHYFILEITTSKYKVIISKSGFFNREEIEIYCV